MYEFHKNQKISAHCSKLSTFNFSQKMKNQCDEPAQGLNSRREATFCSKYPLQNKDHSGTGVRCTIGVPCHNSGKFPEQFRITPEIVSRVETLLVSTDRLKANYMSC